MKTLRGALPDDDGLWSQLVSIVDFINRVTYSTIGDLYTSVKQMFVDMTHAFFTQLPIAIFKSLNESPAEERITLAMKFLFKIESLEAQIQWSFPAGSDISSLITNEAALARLQEVVPRGPELELRQGEEGI